MGTRGDPAGSGCQHRYDSTALVAGPHHNSNHRGRHAQNNVPRVGDRVAACVRRRDDAGGVEGGVQRSFDHPVLQDLPQGQGLRGFMHRTLEEVPQATRVRLQRELTAPVNANHFMANANMVATAVTTAVPPIQASSVDNE